MTVLLWDVAYKVSPKYLPLEAKELPHAWKSLGGYDPKLSVTIARMVQAPAATLAYLKQHFRPAKKVTPGDDAPDKLVADLDRQVRTLEQHHVRFVSPGIVTLADGSRAAMVRDPDGHALLLEDRPFGP